MAEFEGEYPEELAEVVGEPKAAGKGRRGATAKVMRGGGRPRLTAEERAEKRRLQNEEEKKASRRKLRNLVIHTIISATMLGGGGYLIVSNKGCITETYYSWFGRPQRKKQGGGRWDPQAEVKMKLSRAKRTIGEALGGERDLSKLEDACRLAEQAMRQVFKALQTEEYRDEASRQTFQLYRGGLNDTFMEALRHMRDREAQSTWREVWIELRNEYEEVVIPRMEEMDAEDRRHMEEAKAYYDEKRRQREEEAKAKGATATPEESHAPEAEEPEELEATEATEDPEATEEATEPEESPDLEGDD